jgi:hypothetical protein
MVGISVIGRRLRQPAVACLAQLGATAGAESSYAQLRAAHALRPH